MKPDDPGERRAFIRACCCWDWGWRGFVALPMLIVAHLGMLSEERKARRGGGVDA